MQKKIEQNGNCDRKSGSRTGKLMDLTVSTKKLVNNKTGVSQRKIANTLRISQTAARKNIKKGGLKYRKEQEHPRPKTSSYGQSKWVTKPSENLE